MKPHITVMDIRKDPEYANWQFYVVVPSSYSGGVQQTIGPFSRHQYAEQYLDDLLAGKVRGNIDDYNNPPMMVAECSTND